MCNEIISGNISANIPAKNQPIGTSDYFYECFLQVDKSTLVAFDHYNPWQGNR